MRLPTFPTATLAVAAAIAATLVAAPATATAAISGPAQFGVTWTVDPATNSLQEYAASASGAATPIATISGAATGLAHPTAVAIGAHGNLYVANASNSSITEYEAGATGNVAPVATIKGPSTGLHAPSSILLAGGEVWTTDPSTNVLEAFTAGSRGNELPAESIAGPKTRLNHPIGMTFGAEADELSVLNVPATGSPSITVYFPKFPTTKHGNIAPDARITSTKKHPLVSPTAILTAGLASVWVADRGTNSVTKLNVIPGFPSGGSHSIGGARTGLDAPSGLSLNALNQLVVSNAANHSVRVFRAKARGNVAPIRSITGVSTDAGSPAGVDVFGIAPDAPTNLKVVPHNGSATLTWKAPAITGGGLLGYQVDAFQFRGEGGIDEILASFLGIGIPIDTHKTTFTMHHLRNGVRYFFAVTAVNAFGTSPLSNQVRATPLTVPDAPKNLIAAGGANSLAVAWTKPKHNGGKKITHYRVEYATCSPAALGCKFRSQLVAAPHRRVHIHGLAAGTKYHVRVLAQSSVGDGHPSKVITATTN